MTHPLVGGGRADGSTAVDDENDRLELLRFLRLLDAPRRLLDRLSVAFARPGGSPSRRRESLLNPGDPLEHVLQLAIGSLAVAPRGRAFSARSALSTAAARRVRARSPRSTVRRRSHRNSAVIAVAIVAIVVARFRPQPPPPPPASPRRSRPRTRRARARQFGPVDSDRFTRFPRPPCPG